MTTCLISNLPRTVNSTGEICDKYGNKFKYDSATNSWIAHGYIPNIPIVTEQSDGLITPEILLKLIKVKDVLSPIATQPSLKINPGNNAFWYYFKSSDKCIRFRVEGENALRIEVDSGRLYRLFSNAICRGPTGDQGLKGPKGDNGLSAPAEVLFDPIIDKKQLRFSVYTPTPLLDSSIIRLPNDHVPDISIRIYEYSIDSQLEITTHDQLQYLAIYYNKYVNIAQDFNISRNIIINKILGNISLDSTLNDVLILPTNDVISSEPLITILVDPLGIKQPRIINNSGYNINTDLAVDSIDFDNTTNIVSGTITLTTGDWANNLCLKSGQRGPDGLAGDPGESTIRIINTTLDNSNVIATCPIINVRFDDNDNTIYSTCSDITNSICVNNIKVSNKSGILSTDSAINATFAAVIPTTESCKVISKYKVELPDDSDAIDQLELELYHWKPQAGCVTKRHFNRHNFNWMKLVDTEACLDNNLWYDPDMVARRGTYPHAIKRSKAPESDPCVQEDFFYCPNVQIGGCLDNSTPPDSDTNTFTATVGLSSKPSKLSANVRTVNLIV